MQISKYTSAELEDIKAKSNFTKDELALFTLRSEGLTLEQCAELLFMSVSTVKRTSQRVKWKIEKVERENAGA